MGNGNQQTILSLREALRVSPDNAPLRLLLAQTLLGAGLNADAEVEFKEALRRDTSSLPVKHGLARAYLGGGKHSHAIVVLEELLQSRAATAETRVLLAHAYCRSGDLQRARTQYAQAVRDDAGVADEELAELLGVKARPEPPEDEPDSDRRRVRAGDDGNTEEDHGDALSPKGVAREPGLERPRISFADVAGMERIKDEIRLKIIAPLQHPELYRAYGKSIGGGILMYGPPGCGKTHLARATAGEVKAAFINVGISDVLNMWLGESERHLHEIFAQARANAPCVLFFDEADALGAARSDLRQSAGRNLVNQFLNELDGAQHSNEGVLVLAATNAPWHLDPAFRRPGRFDRIIFVPPPDAGARAALVRLLVAGKPAEMIDAETVAKKTDGLSGADLKGMVDLAIEGKLREALARGTPQPIRTKDLLEAAKAVRASTKEWFSAARNHALYANQSGIYDEILDYLKLR